MSILRLRSGHALRWERSLISGERFENWKTAAKSKESITTEPIGADNYVRRGAEFVLAVRANAGPGYFPARRYKRLRRWRNRAPLRDRDGFWQIDGPVGGQNHDRSGFYFAGTAESSS